jgi:parallel beta-helix repeat protein
MPGTRTLFLLGLLLSSLSPAWATNYYVSATGDDSANGLSPANAWASIDKVNAEMGRFGAGDSILFKRGHEFYGSLVVTDEGQAGQPLVIAAYGLGPKPVFTGSRPLLDWIYLGDNVWRATCGDCLKMPSSLFIEDKSYPLGRFPNLDAPNKGYLTIDNANGRTTIVDQDLPASPDWSGAEVVVRTRRWILDRAPVGSHVGNTLNLANGGTSSGMLDGYGYFFTNHVNTLDRHGEWAFDPRDNHLFVYLDEGYFPEELRIEVPVLDQLLSIGFRDFITVRDLRFIHSQDVSVLITHSEGNIFTHCDIEQSGHDALKGTSNDDFVCTYNRIVDTNNNGLTLTDCESCEISYNEIRRTAMHPGMGSNGNGEYLACLLRGSYSNFTYNLIDSAGYNGLYFRGSYLNIHRNVVAYSCLIKDDGAGIYTWQDGSAPDTMRRVTENFILHADGAPEGTSNAELYAAEGIYADDHSANLLIEGNTVAFCGDKGIYLHNSYNVDVLHNVVYATSRQIYLRHDDIAPTWPIRNVQVKHNIFFGTQLSDINVDLFSWREDVFQFGVIDSNYLVNPHNDFRINQIRYNPTFPNGRINTYNFSLAEWQAFTPYDPASQPAPFYLPRYQVDQYLGVNKLTNGDFATDLSGWGCWGNGGGNNCDLSWDANGGLDGGSARFTFNPFTGSSTALIRRTLGPVNAGDQFLLRYDIRGAKAFNALELIMIRKGPTYENIAEVGLRPFSAHRSHQEHLFISDATTTNTRLDLKMGESDSLAWLDNLELIPVQTSPGFCDRQGALRIQCHRPTPANHPYQSPPRPQRPKLL